MGIFDKAKDLAGAHQDKVDSLVDRAGDMLDQRTGGKYASHIDRGQEALKGQYGDPRGEEAPAAEQTPGSEAPAPGAPINEQLPTPEAPMGERQPSVPEGEQPPGDVPPAPGAPIGEERPPV